MTVILLSSTTPNVALPGLRRTHLRSLEGSIWDSLGPLTPSATLTADAGRIVRLFPPLHSFIRRTAYLIGAIGVGLACLVSSAVAELEAPSVVLVAAPGTTIQPEQVVSLTAIVDLDFVPVTQGSIRLCDAVAENCTGVSLIGMEQVIRYGPAAGTATFLLRLPPGIHQYRAIFEGEANAALGYMSTVSEPLSITVTEYQARKEVDQPSDGGAIAEVSARNVPVRYP